MLKKIVLLMLALACLCSFAAAETLFERSLGEMGYSDFTIDGPQETACTQIEFIFPSDLNVFSGQNYAILSLNMDFFPTASENSHIDLNINNRQTERTKTTEFRCSEGKCWERIWIPKAYLSAKNTQNTIDMCIRTSNTTQKIILSADSKIGVYKTAVFSEAEGFLTTAEKKDLVIGETTKIKVILHNSGSVAAQAEIKYARPIAEEKEAFAFIEGKAEAKATVGPGEDLAIEYTIKPRVLESITLPPAVAYFENEFGEEEIIFSSLETIRVREPEKKIEAFISKTRETEILGQTAIMQLNIKNKGKDPLYNLTAELELPKELRIFGEKTQNIEFIGPGETKKLEFTAIASSAGEFEIGCKISYIDLNFSESRCQNTEIIFEQEQIPIEVIAAIILVLIGLVAYVYIMKSK